MVGDHCTVGFPVLLIIFPPMRTKQTFILHIPELSPLFLHLNKSPNHNCHNPLLSTSFYHVQLWYPSTDCNSTCLFCCPIPKKVSILSKDSNLNKREHPAVWQGEVLHSLQFLWYGDIFQWKVFVFAVALSTKRKVNTKCQLTSKQSERIKSTRGKCVWFWGEMSLHISCYGQNMLK